jgi:hypothetical protein
VIYGCWRGCHGHTVGRSGPVLVLLLAQGGEFAFVVFQAAAGAKAIEAETASLLVGAVALSMLISPLLLAIISRWLLPRFANCETTTLEELAEPQSRPPSSRALAATGKSWHACSAPRACPPPCWTMTQKWWKPPARLATRCFTAMRRGWTCCAPPGATTAQRYWWWPWTTWNSRWPWWTWRASTFRT